MAAQLRTGLKPNHSASHVLGQLRRNASAWGSRNIVHTDCTDPFSPTQTYRSLSAGAADANEKSAHCSSNERRDEWKGNRKCRDVDALIITAIIGSSRHRTCIIDRPPLFHNDFYRLLCRRAHHNIITNFRPIRW